MEREVTDIQNNICRPQACMCPGGVALWSGCRERSQQVSARTPADSGYCWLRTATTTVTHTEREERRDGDRIKITRIHAVVTVTEMEVRSQRKRGNNLKTRDGEFGDEFNETRIFLQPHQLPQLVVGLESHHQTTELVVALTVCQSLREREREVGVSVV